MPTTVEQIAIDILELPEPDRAFLAHCLIQSLDNQIDSAAESLWMEEIIKRSTEIRNKSVHCRPMGDVISDIKRKLKNARFQPS